MRRKTHVPQSIVHPVSDGEFYPLVFVSLIAAAACMLFMAVHPVI